jgi:hypothetical protein
LGIGKKITFLGQKGGVPKWESHSYDLFSIPEAEEFLREALPRSFRLAREALPKCSSDKSFREVFASHKKGAPSEYIRVHPRVVGAIRMSTFRLARGGLLPPSSFARTTTSRCENQRSRSWVERHSPSQARRCVFIWRGSSPRVDLQGAAAPGLLRKVARLVGVCYIISF